MPKFSLKHTFVISPIVGKLLCKYFILRNTRVIYLPCIIYLEITRLGVIEIPFQIKYRFSTILTLLIVLIIKILGDFNLNLEREKINGHTIKLLKFIQFIVNRF